MSTMLHRFIEQNNILTRPTERLQEYFVRHRNLYKVILIANHFFRAIAMLALPCILPFPYALNVGLCGAGSLLYRLTVEAHCPYKFALPAFAGAVAIGIAQRGNGVGAVLPLALYIAYIALTVSCDVENAARCCGGRP